MTEHRPSSSTMSILTEEGTWFDQGGNRQDMTKAVIPDTILYGSTKTYRCACGKKVVSNQAKCMNRDSPGLRPQDDVTDKRNIDSSSVSRANIDARNASSRLPIKDAEDDREGKHLCTECANALNYINRRPLSTKNNQDPVEAAAMASTIIKAMNRQSPVDFRYICETSPTIEDELLRPTDSQSQGTGSYDDNTDIAPYMGGRRCDLTQDPLVDLSYDVESVTTSTVTIDSTEDILTPLTVKKDGEMLDVREEAGPLEGRRRPHQVQIDSGVDGKSGKTPKFVSGISSSLRLARRNHLKRRCSSLIKSRGADGKIRTTRKLTRRHRKGGENHVRICDMLGISDRQDSGSDLTGVELVLVGQSDLVAIGCSDEGSYPDSWGERRSPPLPPMVEPDEEMDACSTCMGPCFGPPWYGVDIAVNVISLVMYVL